MRKQLDKKKLALIALAAQVMGLSHALNAEGAIPADFEEDEELGGFQFDGDDGFETRNEWGHIGGAAYEHGVWSHWKQDHE